MHAYVLAFFWFLLCFFFLVSVSILIVLMYLLLINCCSFAVNITYPPVILLSCFIVLTRLKFGLNFPSRGCNVQSTKVQYNRTCTGTLLVLCHKSCILQHRSGLRTEDGITHAFPASHR